MKIWILAADLIMAVVSIVLFVQIRNCIKANGEEPVEKIAEYIQTMTAALAVITVLLCVSFLILRFL